MPTIYQHKETKQLLSYKRGNAPIYTMYLLDDNKNKIPNGKNIKGEPDFKIGVFRTNNIIELCK